MFSKKPLWGALAAVLIVFGAIQFAPSAPLAIPSQLASDQREAHRLLNFEEIANFRDMGGYATEQGKRVKWGVLYRSGTLAQASDSDLKGLTALGLTTLMDFRSTPEKAEEPNHLPSPPGFEVVEIPTLDDGNEAMVGDIMRRIETGDFTGFDPKQTMLQANRQFASEFTPQFREFIQTVQTADGAPVMFHCSAGKDRTGFAAAILLRLLGVPHDTVVADYMASKQHALEARKSQLMLLRLFKGQEAANKVAVLMGVEQAWIEAAFDEIDSRWGEFDAYAQSGLGLSSADIEQLRRNLLE